MIVPKVLAAGINIRAARPGLRFLSPMENMEQSEDLLRTDIATARAVVTIRKAATTSKGALAHGQHSSTCKLECSTTGTSAKFQQQQGCIASAAAFKAAEEATGLSQLSGGQPNGSSGSVVLNLWNSSRSASPPPHGVSTAVNDTIEKPQNVHTVLQCASSHDDKEQKQQVSHAQSAQGTQEQQEELKQAADQVLARPVQLQCPNASKLTADTSSLVPADEQGPATCEQTVPKSAGKLQGKKRGRPSNKDRKPTSSTSKLPDLTEQNVGGTADWSMLQQQQYLQSMNAAASPPLKLRKKPGRPPKSASSLMAMAEQQGQPANRLSSAGSGHGVGLDEPCRLSGWPAALGGLQPVTSHTSHQQQASADMSTWSDAGVEATAAPGAGMRTRLSVRSVAYLEDLLEQTAQAAASTVGTTNGKDVQTAGRANGRGGPTNLAAASSGRLSVGSLIISPPMSRASSMYQTTAGSSPPKRSPAAAGVQTSTVAAKPSSPADVTGTTATGQLPLTSAAANHSMAPPGPVVGDCAGSPAPLRLQQQHRSSGLATGHVPEDSHSADTHNMAGPGTLVVPDALLEGHGAAEVGAAAATAEVAGVVAGQQAATVSATGHVSKDSLSSGEEESEQDADVWAAAAGAANKCATSRQACSSSDTCSSPSSGAPVLNPCFVGPFTAARGAASMGVAQGLLYGGLLQSFGGAPAALLPNPAVVAGGAAGAAGAPGVYGPAACPRKSDRQVGLETVQVIDAIFQQSRSIQAGQAANIAVQNTPVDSSVPAIPQHCVTDEGANTPPATESAPAEGQEAPGDDRCTVAALCRGLRFDGDITLKEVAMAFQLRDAYDWDEDLEAAGKEDKEVEDPRLKNPKLMSHSPSASNSSVCPDPEPVLGFLHRSTWMAGNGREGASPVTAKLHQSGLQLGPEFHLGAVAVGLPPALLQRLHNQSCTGLGSQPGSISSSRRASFAGSPVNAPSQEGGNSWQQQSGEAPAPAALHAAICTAAQKDGPRGWAAMMPGTDSPVQAHPHMHPSNMHCMQQYPYMPMKAPGRGAGRGRKRKNADNSDDDYDPRKPSHQQEVYQRKHIDRRAQQQQLQQQQLRSHNPMSQYGYSYQAMQQAYSAAATQQAYIMQAASRSGTGFSMQQLQQLQQLQFMQQHAQMAMAAIEEQAAAAAAAAASGCEQPAVYDCAYAAPPAASPGTAVSAQQPAARTYLQGLVSSMAHLVGRQPDEGQQQQQQGIQQLQSAKPSPQQPERPVQQQQHQQDGCQPSQQQQQQKSLELQQQQPVRRPSYVKRRLTADDAADWLQSHAPDSLRFRRQLEAPRLALDSAIDHIAAAEQGQGLQILSPTAVKPPPSLSGQPLAPAASEDDHPPDMTAGRMRRRTLAGLQHDIIHGHGCASEAPVGPSADIVSDDDIDIESDVSDPEVGYSVGARGGRRGGRGGRGRGRTSRGRGRGAGRTSGALSMSTTGSPAPEFQAAGSTAAVSSPATSSTSPAVQSISRGRGRGRGSARGRLGAGRGRSCLSSGSLAADPAAVGGCSAAVVTAQKQQQSVQQTLVSPAAAAEPSSGFATAAETDMPHGSRAASAAAASAAAATAAVTISVAGVAPVGRGRGRGRVRGRGRATNAVPAPSAELLSAPAAAWIDSKNGMALTADVSPAGSVVSNGGRRGRGSARGRGRLGRPLSNSNVAGSPTPCDRAIAAAFPQQAPDRSRESGAYGSALHVPYKKQKLMSSAAVHPAELQQQTSGPKEGSAEQGLASMPALSAAEFAQDTQAPTAKVMSPSTAQQAKHKEVSTHQGPLSSQAVGLRLQATAINADNKHGHQAQQQKQEEVAQGVQIAEVAEGPVMVQTPDGGFQVADKLQQVPDFRTGVMMSDLACNETLL